MNIGILKERSKGENRVSVVPNHVPALIKLGYTVYLEKDAGTAAGYSNEQYQERGAVIIDNLESLIKKVDVLLTIRAGAADNQGESLANQLKEKQIIIGLLEPYQPHQAFDALLNQGVTSFSMELIPRTTRAQSMDVLSSMANLAGYAAAVFGAEKSTKIFPMMMTAAGTIPPANVFVLGVGVAGLQAIATSKRLGAVVSAYDVRSEVKEQVLSLGAKFVEFDLESASGEGGYAKQMDEAYYKKQRELMKEELSNKDVVITTANIPGKKAPILITETMVKGMQKGSVIIDLAAERGGNCELTESGKTVVKHGVTIVGLENVAAHYVNNASMLYSKNITTFLNNLWDKKELGKINWEDDIVLATVVTHQKEIPNEKTRSWIGGKTS
ncbi:Re/Si-specific NAD(P)(+) transhydrogenase subunit alpha [Peloplasma aerotolerans]|uniref:NAD(P) transhydrogenase subunit alpha part 1 n=1 Tax=Peloplasma aerotolerans TaxID=3044389 RepID=A0AAW6UAP1_9MOLU|nr:Re/Si-specific NAD(P)(+) transhydrogenase subunit alpha [Mariniplasma sp. M4Ah]MDI6453764.1 Re/Si-specific NAD(P)(+) transhydrogenase subunit alpha [Mariniplasma sp. M4Ah]